MGTPKYLRRIANLAHGLLLVFAVLCAVVIVASLCQGILDAAAYVTYVLAVIAYCSYAHAIRCLVPESAGEAGGKDASDDPPLAARVQSARRTLLALCIAETVVTAIAVFDYLWVSRGVPGTPVPGVGLALAPGFPDLSALSAIFGTADTSSVSPRLLFDAPLGIFVLLLWVIERKLGPQGTSNGKRKPGPRGAYGAQPTSAKTGQPGRKIES